MIRINLLPIRAAKKKETARFQLTVGGLITTMFIIISLGVYLMVRNAASALSQEIAADKSELDDLANKLGKLSQIEEEKGIVQEKLDTIAKLEESKSSQVNFFKVIANAMPDKTWLDSVKDLGPDVTIKGYAADEKLVAEVQRRLQDHIKDFGSPELVVAQRVTEKETGAEVVGFEIHIVKPVVVAVKEKKGKKKEAAKKS